MPGASITVTKLSINLVHDIALFKYLMIEDTGQTVLSRMHKGGYCEGKLLVPLGRNIQSMITGEYFLLLYFCSLSVLCRITIGIYSTSIWVDTTIH